ncbi:MAG: RnfABCDGE type electron transport complex subunit G [Clostridia bacterium]|nr:RnfABCDGE type electron transport complex subunit G [Clostridia bacterium]
MKENIRSIIKTGAILLAIGFICTLILSLCNYMTKDKIAALALETEEAAMKEVIPEAKYFVKLEEGAEGIVTDVYVGKDTNMIVVGYCVKVKPVGYGGEISMIVGVDTDGVVTGVKITEMSETPGLGAKANDDGFTEAYKGKTGGIKVRKSGTPGSDEISAISGATVTSKAVTEGVNAAVETVNGLQ